MSLTWKLCNQGCENIADNNVTLVTFFQQLWKEYCEAEAEPGIKYLFWKCLKKREEELDDKHISVSFVTNVKNHFCTFLGSLIYEKTSFVYHNTGNSWAWPGEFLYFFPKQSSEESGEQRNWQRCDLFSLMDYNNSVGRKGAAAGSFSVPPPPCCFLSSRLRHRCANPSLDSFSNSILIVSSRHWKWDFNKHLHAWQRFPGISPPISL